MSITAQAQTPTVNPRVVAAQGVPDPLDPNNLAAFDDEIWTSFTGTSQDELVTDPNNNPSVIWSSLIELA